VRRGAEVERSKRRTVVSEEVVRSWVPAPGENFVVWTVLRGPG
jgi:hypothetical protein